MFYTSFDNFDQFFFVLVFDHVDFLPGFVLNLFPRFFINFQQMVDLSLQLFTLSVFLLLLESLVDFELFERFLLEEVHFRNFLTESFFLLFFLKQQLLVPFVVSIHFLLMLTLFYLKLFLVQADQVRQFSSTSIFNLPKLIVHLGTQ